jgi:Protein of unknown function (DUF3147)
MGELLIRFLLGGVVVSFFAAVAEMCEPKTLAGIFGAAPSVALATLSMAFLAKGGEYVALEGRSMIIGAIALALYSVSCVTAAKRSELPVWLGAAASWIIWFAAAFGLWHLGVVIGAAQ